MSIALLLLQLVVLFFLSTKFKQQLFRVLFLTTKNQSLTISLLSLLLFPGTMVHELAHLLTAGILFVPVGHMELVPQVVKGTIRAGSVQIGKTDPFRQTLVGIAPLFVGLALLYTIARFLLPSLNYSVTPLLNYVLSLYLIFTISSTMFSSKKDMDAAKVVLPVIVILGISAWIAGVKLPYPLVAGISAMIAGVIQTLNFALALALGVHGIFLFFLYLTRFFTKP